MDPAYAAPGTEGYAEGAPADQQYTEATNGSNGWYGDQTAADPNVVAAAPVEQQGFSIPTTGGGGPMRQGRGGGGGARYNPMGRGKPGAGDPGVPASAANAEKNELGFIIFAYNIGYQTDEGQLHGVFAPYGNVAKVNVIQDFATGQGKGFGFVTMADATEAENAVNSLNGSDFMGNTLQIRFKSPKGQNPPNSRGGRGGMMRGGRGGGMRGGRGGGMRGGGFRGGRGAPRGVGNGRGRGRGAYSQAPSAYDAYGYAQPTYDQYGGYADPNAAAGYGAAAATSYETYDPYAGYGAAAGTGYASYGAAGTPQW